MNNKEPTYNMVYEALISPIFVMRRYLIFQTFPRMKWTTQIFIPKEWRNTGTIWN